MKPESRREGAGVRVSSSRGSTVVYEPLLGRLPADAQCGFERVEGPIEERAQQYVPKLIEMQGDGPYVLVGCRWAVCWPTRARSVCGGRQGVRSIRLIDAVRAGDPADQEEIRKRWNLAAFAEDVPT